MKRKARQYAALPIRDGKSCKQVLLITSRFTKRWVLPKGWPIKKLTAWQTAEREAFEEAGLKGKMERKAIGTFEYDKWIARGKVVRCKVKVYAMKVSTELPTWPEVDERIREWVTFDEAAERVQEPELKSIFKKLAG